MTMTTDHSIRDSSVGTLTALRALAAEPSAPIADALRATEAQAQLLRDLLHADVDQLVVRLADLIPTILIEYIDDLPVAGVSFWGNGHWHIHIRASDPEELQLFATLHEVKHIIDHPIRQGPNSLNDASWEALANHFARHVLIIESVHFVRIEGKEKEWLEA